MKTTTRISMVSDVAHGRSEVFIPAIESAALATPAK